MNQLNLAEPTLKEPTSEFVALINDIHSALIKEDQETALNTFKHFNQTSGSIAPYRLFSSDRYQRNLVYRSDLFELLILCWEPGQLSPLHNHKGSHCYVRVLEGVATELKFDRAGCGVLVPASVSRLGVDQVAVSNDEDIHSVANFESTNLVTLHCYSPPLSNSDYFSVNDSFIPGLLSSYSSTEANTDSLSGTIAA